MGQAQSRILGTDILGRSPDRGEATRCGTGAGADRNKLFHVKRCRLLGCDTVADIGAGIVTVVRLGIVPVT